jgi:excisionase family DNA binding protein
MAYITTEELAELIRTPESSLRYWRHRGEGPRYFKVGRRVLYDTEDVQTWIAQQASDRNAVAASA